MRLGLLLLLLAGCGKGPQLSNLRCRAADCQSTEDPLKLLLAVDFNDDTGTLDKGALDLRVNGNSQQTVSLADIFTAQGIAAGTKRVSRAIRKLLWTSSGGTQRSSLKLIRIDSHGRSRAIVASRA